MFSSVDTKVSLKMLIASKRFYPKFKCSLCNFLKGTLGMVPARPFAMLTGAFPCEQLAVKIGIRADEVGLGYVDIPPAH